MTSQIRRRRTAALAGATGLIAALGWAAGAQGAPGAPGAVAPSGYVALDPCPSSTPCPPKVTVGWGAASWSEGALLHRRYVLEPLAGDLGVPAAFETGSNTVTLDVRAPADGRLFRFRVFGRETKITIPDLNLEIPREVVIPDRFWDLPVRLTTPGLRVVTQIPLPRQPVRDVIREPVFPELVPIPTRPTAPQLLRPFDPNAPDGPATSAEFRIDAAAPSLSLAQSATHIGAGESVSFSATAADPPSGPTPGSGVEATGYVWDFGDGTTGAGPSAEHRYRAAGSYAGAVGVRDRAGNVAQRAFTVKVSAVTTDGAATSTPTGRAKTTRVGGRARISGTAALQGLGVSLRQPVLRAAWHASRLQGAISLRGTSSGSARLKLRLRAAGLKPLDIGALPSGSGPFRSRLALPAGVLPGALTIEVAEGSLVVARLRLRVPAPAEGVARTAFAAGSRGGGPLTSAPGSSRILFARFGLAALPAAGRPLTVTWYQPNGEVAGHPVRKPRRRALTSFVRSSQALPAGLWRAVLTAGGVRVAHIGVRVG